MSGRLRGPLLVALTVGLVVVALVFIRSIEPTEESNPSAAVVLTATEEPDLVGPDTPGVDPNEEWRRSAAGASSAAVDCLYSLGLIAMAGPLERADLIGALATSDYREPLTATTNRQLDNLLFALGGRGFAPSDLEWHEYPISSAVGDVSGDEATVQVWSVSVVLVEGGSVARQLWHTDTLSLVRQDGAWKVNRWDSAPGPTPGLGSEVELSTPSDLAATAAWPPATRMGERR